MRCPYDGCDYESSELGVQQHHARTHGESLTVETFTCDYCEEDFEKHRSKVEPFDRTFCSVKCRSLGFGEEQSSRRQGEGNPNWKGKHTFQDVEIVCETCGDETVVPRYQYEKTERNFCSHDCYAEKVGEIMGGENHPSWQENFTSEYGYSWRVKRREALLRDQYRCQRCGMADSTHHEEFGRQIEVHHIEPVRTFDDPDDAHYLDNLVTLCKGCHITVEHGADVQPVEV